MYRMGSKSKASYPSNFIEREEWRKSGRLDCRSWSILLASDRFISLIRHSEKKESSCPPLFYSQSDWCARCEKSPNLSPSFREFHKSSSSLGGKEFTTERYCLFWWLSQFLFRWRRLIPSHIWGQCRGNMLSGSPLWFYSPSESFLKSNRFTGKSKTVSLPNLQSLISQR